MTLRLEPLGAGFVLVRVQADPVAQALALEQPGAQPVRLDFVLMSGEAVDPGAELWARGPDGAILRPIAFGPAIDPRRVFRVRFDVASIHDESEPEQVVRATLYDLAGRPVPSKRVDVHALESSVASVAGGAFTSSAAGVVTFVVSQRGLGETAVLLVVDDVAWRLPVQYSRRAWAPRPAGFVLPVDEPAPWERIDHAALAQARTITQYRESARFQAFIRATLAQMTELERLAWSVLDQLDVEQAQGINLDVLGELVGVSRFVPDGLQLAFFGFADTPGAVGFGEAGRPDIGARFIDRGESATAASYLADPEYRLLIRARIAKNHATGTVADAYASLERLFGAGTPSVIEDTQRMSFGVSIGRHLTLIERQLVRAFDLLPRPAGVAIDSRAAFDAARYFGFDGQPGARGFGEAADAAAGGTFAESF